MTIKEDIILALRQQVPIAEIRQKYRSVSQIYEGIRIFSEEMDKIFVRKKKKLGTIEEQLQQVKTEVKLFTLENEKIKKENRMLKDQSTNLEKKVEYGCRHILQRGRDRIIKLFC